VPRKAVYQAFLDRDAVASWLPPETMTGRVHTFGPREGGVGRCVGRCDRSAPPERVAAQLPPEAVGCSGLLAVVVCWRAAIRSLLCLSTHPVSSG